MNPFLLKGYIGPAYFCGREEEADKLITALRNQQDVTLYAYRRLGKSALLHHVGSKIQSEFFFVNIDIWGTSSINDFLKELSNGVVNSAIFNKRGLSKKLQDFIKSLGASFNFGLDGRPSLDITFQDKANAFKSLEDVLSFLNQQSKPIVLAIDEFQEIKKYDSDSVTIEAVLRTLTQRCSNIRFVYSGSEHHSMDEIFNTYNRPFYQSTRMLPLQKIDKKAYIKFIAKHFKEGKKKITNELIEQVLDITYLHTYYVQAIFNYLYSLEKIPNDWSDFERAYYPFLEEKSVFYQELPQRITAQQFKVAKAIAKVDKVSAPTGSDFLRKADFTNASSMRRAIKSLEEKQIILKEEGTYRLYDVFLEHYLKYIVR